MILSMTGYGKSVVELPDKKVHVEIKSLNSKNFDMTVKIAPIYREKEIGLRSELAALLVHGKVDLYVWVEKCGGDATVINTETFATYCRQIKGIAANLSLPLPTDWFQTVLRLPDVMNSADTDELSQDEWTAVHNAIMQAADELISFRKQEGAALDNKFREKIDNIAAYLKEVEHYEKERVDKIKARITESLNNTGVEYDKNRLEQELIYYIEKLDVNEEKQRLSNHLRYFISTLDGEPGQGKKLGFIAQEMGREINTLGSKSNHAEMQKIVVHMKDELEQIKEQVLNVM